MGITPVFAFYARLSLELAALLLKSMRSRTQMLDDRLLSFCDKVAILIRR